MTSAPDYSASETEIPARTGKCGVPRLLILRTGTAEGCGNTEFRLFAYFSRLPHMPSIPRIHWPPAVRSVPSMVIVSLILAILTVPMYQLIYGPNIDDSLHWAFNYFADGNYRLAEQIAFPHGPLSFLLHPILMGNNFFVALAVQLLAAASFTFIVLFTQRARGHLYPGTSVCALLLLISVCDLQLLLIGMVVSMLTLNRLRPRKFLIILCVIPAVAAILVKAYAGFICGLLIGGEIVFRIGRGEYKPALQTVALYCFFFTISWWLVFGHLSSAGSFVWSQLQLALDNSEAVQFYNADINWWLAGAMIVAFLALYPLIDEPLGKQYYILMVLPVFAAWKHGMGRAETSHMAGLFHFLVLFVVLLWLLSPQRHGRVITVSLLIPLLFGLQLFLFENYKPAAGMHMFRLDQLRQALFDHQSLAEKKGLEIRHATRGQNLPEPVKALLANNPVDVYPWNYSLIATNGLTWRPRRVLNSYAAYTPWLDRRDSSWFAADDAPKFVLWHFSDPNERGYQFESIDNRYILNDQPLMLPAFLCNYERRITAGEMMLFEKRAVPLEADRKKVDRTIVLDFDSWTDVPVLRDGSLLRARITMNKNLAGSLKSLLYKGEIFYVFYELEDGRVLSHRIVPKNAEHGLWLSPFLLSPAVYGTAVVRRIMLQCNDHSKMKEPVTLHFEKISFTDKSGEKDVCGFFSDRCIDSTAIVFQNGSSVDYVRYPRFFIDRQSAVSTTDFLTPPASYAIREGDTSGLFVVPMDSILAEATTRYRIILLANVKAPVKNAAVFVVSTDPALKESDIIYRKPLSEITRGNAEWTNCSAYFELSAAQAATIPRLYFGLINYSGARTLLVDDMWITLLPVD